MAASDSADSSSGGSVQHRQHFQQLAVFQDLIDLVIGEAMQQ